MLHVKQRSKTNQEISISNSVSSFSIPKFLLHIKSSGVKVTVTTVAMSVSRRLEVVACGHELFVLLCANVMLMMMLINANNFAAHQSV